MFLRQTVLSILVMCCCIYSGFAQKQALSKIDIADLKEHLTFFASDELQGRKLGTEVDGLGIAANYLANHAQNIGLKPGCENFFQQVRMNSVKPAEDNFIEIKNAKGKSIFKSHSLIIFQGIQGKNSLDKGEVALAGFGDNLSEEKVEGELVIISQGNAKSFNKGDDIRFNYGFEIAKIKKLAEQKPRMILLVTTPQDVKNDGFNRLKGYFNRERYSADNENSTAEVPVLFLTPDFADKLLGRKGEYAKYLKNIAKVKTSGWKLLPQRKVNLSAEIVTEELDAKNVLGIVEGSDPELKNEYVVFMAHYDHLGISKDGDVYNGADDNGSGTVALMEVAEAFAALPQKPKRSIVFLWVTCEEIGHIGSTYYCDNPVYPLEKTVASINLDMVGRVYEAPRDDVWKDSPKKVKDFDGLYTLSNDVWPQLAEINNAKCKELGIVPDTSLPKARFLRASDHYHFHKKGVPILNYSTGYHADYHKVGDELEKINFKKIKRVADLCFLLGYEVANLEKIEIIHLQ